VSGTKSLVDTILSTKATLQSYTRPRKSPTTDPEPSQAIQWLRSTAKSYCFVIPGASGYIDSAFDEIGTVRHKHGMEADIIIKEAYEELKEVSSKDGMSLASASKAWGILQRLVQRMTDPTSEAGQDILNNHPVLKDKFGSSLDALKKMGKKCGPEAQKQVDDATRQIKEIVKNGMSAGTIPKIQSLLQEKTEKVRGMGSTRLVCDSHVFSQRGWQYR